MIYVICGPTGVGKTKLSILLAKKKNAIVLNADSMQVYKELNIATAKIKKDEMENVPHYLFDIVSIKDEFNAYIYQKMGRKILENFKDRNIIVVGGTGLYIKALLYDYDFKSNNKNNNKLYNFIMIGLTKDRTNLYTSINNRVDEMVSTGLIEEANSLYEKFKDNRAVNAAIGYKELFSYFKGDISLEEAISLIKKNSRHYAKRQYTFFNNQFDNINWYNVDEVNFSLIVDEICKRKV